MLNLKFFRPREKFLILEVSPEKSRALLLGVDEDKNLTLEKHWQDFSFKKLNTLNVKNLRRRKLIVSAVPELLYTVTLPVGLKRAQTDAGRPLALVELENSLVQVIGKLFGVQRKNASAHLGVHEIDAILVDSKVHNFKIDGHAILNPVGFSGRTIAAVLELAFTTRQVFQDLKDFFNAKEGFFFTGSDRAGVGLFAKIGSLPANLLVLGGDTASCLTLERAAWGNLIYRKEFGWLPESLFGAIAASFGVSQPAATQLYDIYFRGRMSPYAAKAFYRAMKTEIDNFLAAIKKLGLRGGIYLNSPVSLPLDMSVSYGRVRFAEMPLPQLLDRAGFRTDLSAWPFAANEMFMRLAPFFEFYFDKSDSEINHKLRRRIHWLIQ